MDLKHLLVHVDSGARAPERIDLAVTLAKRFGATVAGLFAEAAQLGRSVVARRSPQNLAKALADARAVFEAKVRAAGVPSTWWEIEQGEYGHVVGWAAVCCRYVDLAVFGQAEEGEDARLPEDLVQQVLFESGRPLLVVPSVGHYPDVGKRVLVAWTASREAARAVNDALPFLARAAEVRVIAFQHAAPERSPGGTPPLDIVAHLRTHGIEAKYERQIVAEEGVVDQMLNRAADWSADLVVLGAYEQRGFPFLQRSDTTRDVLRTMTAPVLLSR
jgi:nucleotide-binding universal stress UspA family protein